MWIYPLYHLWHPYTIYLIVYMIVSFKPIIYILKRNKMEESKQENGQISAAEQAAKDEQNLNEAIAALPENLKESILKMIDSTVKQKVEAQMKVQMEKVNEEIKKLQGLVEIL